MQNAPSTLGLTSPQFVWQNADTNPGLSACLRAPLTRLATLRVLVAGLPGEDWKDAASSSNSWPTSIKSNIAWIQHIKEFELHIMVLMTDFCYRLKVISINDAIFPIALCTHFAN